MIGRRQSILWANMLVVRMSDDLGMVRGIVVAEDALPLAQVGVSVTHTDRIAQFCADNFVEVE